MLTEIWRGVSSSGHISQKTTTNSFAWDENGVVNTSDSSPSSSPMLNSLVVCPTPMVGVVDLSVVILWAPFQMLDLPLADGPPFLEAGGDLPRSLSSVSETPEEYPELDL